MTIKSFGQAFSKACGVKGQSPLWDFKGRSPLMDKNSKQNLRKQILTINYLIFNRSGRKNCICQ